jgi:rSAM/selenodomain-associated transferase 2
LGPAADGGYGPIGLRRAIPDLFRGITWSTDQVLKQTLSKAAAAGLKVKVLPALRDVDRPEDLPVWERVDSQFISIIIPTLDEGGDLAQTLRAVGRPADTEVIIADGGSRDATLSIAEKAGAKVVRCLPGRGGQLNAGAAAAIGDILVFLHADTRLPEDFAQLVRGTLKDPEVAGGAFALRFEPCPPLLKINEVTANWRTRLFRLPFGDQAIFVRSSLFRLMGGFRKLPLMEDVDFARRLHQAGRTVFLPSPVRTSSRRYSGKYWRRNLINKVVFAGYLMGIPPDRLARIYRAKNPHLGARTLDFPEETKP